MDKELPETMRFNFPFNLIGKSINHANHGAYSNPGTQAGTQNKDFGTVPQSDVTKKFVSVCGSGWRGYFKDFQFHCQKKTLKVSRQ